MCWNRRTVVEVIGDVYAGLVLLMCWNRRTVVEVIGDVMFDMIRTVAVKIEIIVVICLFIINVEFNLSTWPCGEICGYKLLRRF